MKHLLFEGKRSLCRALALFLCFAMLLGITPVFPQAEAAEAAVFDYNLHKLQYGQWGSNGHAPDAVYNYYKTMAGNSQELTTYSGAKTGPFASTDTTPFYYYAKSEGSTYAWGDQAYCWYLVGTGSWASTAILVPNSGTYTLSYNAGLYSQSGKVNVYFAPIDAENHRAEEYFVGELNPYSSTSDWNKLLTVGTVTADAGEYVLTAEIASEGNLYGGSFRLSSTAAKKTMTLSAGNGGALTVNRRQTASYPINALIDGTAVSAANATYAVVEPVDGSVVSATVENGNLNLVGLSEGSTTVNLRVAVNGVMGWVELPVSVTNIVDESAYSVDLGFSRNEIGVGGTHYTEVKLFYYDEDVSLLNATNLSAISSAPSVASTAIELVDGKMMLSVTGLKAGTATIAVKFNADGKYHVKTVDIEATEQSYSYNLKRLHWGELSTDGTSPSYLDDWDKLKYLSNFNDYTSDLYRFHAQSVGSTWIWSALSPERGPIFTGKNGDFASIRVRLDEIGVYRPSVSYFAHPDGETFNVYFAPADEENWMSDKYLLGEIDTYADEELTDEVKTFDYRSVEAGEYIIGFEATGSSSYQIGYFGDVTFDMVGIPWITSYAEIPSVLSIGGDVTVNLRAVFAGRGIPFANASVSVDDTSVVSADLTTDGVSENAILEIEGRKIGETEITVTMEYNGLTGELVIPISVQEFAFVRKNYNYNWLKVYYGPWSTSAYDPCGIDDYCFTTRGDPNEMNLDIATDPWMYGGDGGNINDVGWNSSSRDYGIYLHGHPGAWTSYKIRVDQTGVYTPSVSYTSWLYGGLTDIYLAPADAENPRDAKYFLGQYSGYNSELKKGLSFAGSPTLLRAGEYVVSYVIAGTSAHGVFSDSFSLKAPAGNYIHIYPDDYSYVLQGNEMTIPLNAIRNDAPIDFRQIDSCEISVDDSEIAEAELTVENNQGFIVVTGKSVGVANIKVTAKRYSNTCEITIPVDVVGIGERKLSLDKGYLIPGETTKLHASVALTNGVEITPDELNAMGVKTTVATLKAGIVELGEDGLVTGLAAGTTAIRMTMVLNGKTTYSGVSVRVYDQKYSSLSVNVENATMYPDETQQLIVNALTDSTSSSNVIGAENVQFTYKSSGAGLTVSDTGLLTAKEVGTYWVDVSGTYDGVTYTTGIQITVAKNGGKSLTLEVPVTRLKLGGDTMQATAKLTTLSGDVLVNESVTFTSSNSCVSVSQDGVLTAKAVGNAVITATAGSLSQSVTINVTDGKAYSTFYTKEKLANMRYNVENFLWASSLPSAYGSAADQYLGKVDMLYDNITTQELPRACAVGVRWDPNMYRCRYCNVDLREGYSNYPWVVDPVNHPWKIQCPACSRYFPSNDFESYYKTGIDANGNWDYDLAKKNGTAYLVNKEYPEKGSGWGVDDGYGYKTGKTITLENSAANANKYGKTHEEIHTYIAYYNHWGSWYGSGNSSMYGLTAISLDRLTNAYVYTGDPKYGRIGAILVSRIADVYPSMKIEPYFPWFFNSDSTSPYGKVVGCIWESGMVNTFIKAYDAFYDLYDDPEVISYLSAKATKYNQSNKKTTGNLIRDHIEENLVREAYRSVLNGNIHGNFGMHQSVAANAAVVLDNPTESKEMIDWLFKSESGSTKGDVKGGNFTAQIFENVSRDGTGMEAAPNYNGLWINSVNTIIETLGGYKGYSGSDLYQNPKIIKMYKMHFPLTQTRKGTYAIGDSGATAQPSFHLPSIGGLSKAFLATGDVEIAQMIYFRNGNSTKNLNGDVFSNSTELRTKIEAVIAEHGEYPFDKSVQMSGFGIDILRSGTLTEEADTQQDFWIYYGKTGGHGHPAALNLGMDAYGLDIAPDLGYPEAADGGYKNIYWGQASVNHNLVMVNDARQTAISPNGTPLHFDDAGRVKVSDVRAKAAYSSVNDYRRALVSVQVNDEISYGVDFFLVDGGSEHVYSFHALSNEIVEASSNLTLVPQSSGTYAGTNVALGANEDITNGYNFLYNVRRAKNPGKNFSVNFKIKDYRNTISADRQLYLKMTMLNDFELSEVAFAKGQPPQRDGNPTELEFVLARRSGSNMLSLFTTVFEPYDKTSYISSIERVAVSRTGGANPGSRDCGSGVKVTLKNGRVDYIVFATNKDVQYRVDGLFDFKGTFGVYTLENGVPTYAYINDGTIIGQTKTMDAYTGSVVDFTKTLEFKNTLTVSLGQSIRDVTELVGRSIYVTNQGGGNATYVIKGAKKLTNGNVELDLGDTTLIRGLTSTTATDTYTYDVAVGQNFRIPLSASSDNNPVFEEIPKQSIPINQEKTFVVRATDPNGQTLLSYRAISLPDGATFDATTQRFTWTPKENQVGSHKAVFSVTNGTRTAEMTVDFDVFYNTNVSAVGLTNGAQIRLTGKTGLRFISKVSQHFLDEITEKGATDIEYGTLLVPSDGVVDLDEFVIDGKVGPYSVVKVPAVYNYSMNDEWIQYTAVLVDIAPKNFKRVYAARAYVKYRDAEGEHVIYGDTRVERSIYQIAEAALNDSGRYSDEEIAVLESIVTERRISFTVQEPAEVASTGDATCSMNNLPFTIQTSWTRTGGYAFSGEFMESTDYTVKVVLTMTGSKVFDDSYQIDLNGEAVDTCTISEDGKTLTFTKLFVYRDSGFTGMY